MHRFFPAPPVQAVHFSFITIHFYALMILIGIFVAIFLTKHRYVSQGFEEEDIYEIAARVIPAGIIGGRIYHVITSPDAYFGKNGRPLDAVKIWQGGMGIWGAVSLGALFAYLYFAKRERKGDFPIFADALAPGLLLAQAIGRWGNWFNNELFGRPSSLPWALNVPIEFRPQGFETYSHFHPTFLYESLWCLLIALFLWILPRRFQVVRGNLFVLYIALYCVGRLVIESMRIDAAHHIAGLRLNVWVRLMGFCVATYFFVRKQKGSR